MKFTLLGKINPDFQAHLFSKSQYFDNMNVLLKDLTSATFEIVPERLSSNFRLSLSKVAVDKAFTGLWSFSLGPAYVNG